MRAVPQLHPIVFAEETAHPDRAILDRISDPVARSVYRRRIEWMEDSRYDSTLPGRTWLQHHEEER